jgi:hypothetical protein
MTAYLILMQIGRVNLGGTVDQSITTRIGQPGQGNEDRTTRTGQQVHNYSQERAARTGSQNRTTITGQPGKGSQRMTARKHETKVKIQ